MLLFYKFESGSTRARYVRGWFDLENKFWTWGLQLDKHIREEIWRVEDKSNSSDSPKHMVLSASARGNSCFYGPIIPLNPKP